MASPIYVEIEMPVYLKKYLISISDNKKEPLELPHGHEYSILIRNITTNRMVERIGKGEDVIKIRLPFSRIKDPYFYNKIGINNRKYFREQIRLDFYYDFRLFLKDRIMGGVQRKIAIEQFFELHKIEEGDVKFESFYRNFTRFNNKKLVKFNKDVTSRLFRSMCPQMTL
jgi:hypothetical protein